MSEWNQSGLCLCRSEDSFGAGHCLHAKSRQWSSVVGGNRSTVGGGDFPILTICQTAMTRRLMGKQPQVLILHDGSKGAGVSQAKNSGWDVWVQAVEVCSLDCIDHADILLALALGFDHVLVHQVSAVDIAVFQSQEAELARAMGGEGRVHLFGSAKQLLSGIMTASDAAGPWKTMVPLVSGSRRDMARTCAAVLLPDAGGPVSLPMDSPYGAVQLDTSACSLCQSCVWLCPTDALSIGDGSSELGFVESRCIQCGMCRSICPEDALLLEPRLDLTPSANTRKTLHQAAPVYCHSCGVVVAKPLMGWLRSLFPGGGREPSKTADQSCGPLCGACRFKQSQSTGYRQLADVNPIYCEPKRGR